MLDGFDDRRAQAACVFGYFDGEHLELFRGGMSGVVADHPRGENGFGWDQIFCPDDYNGRTRAELNDEQYQTTYLTIKPLMQVRKYLENNLQLANSETDV